MAKPVLVLGTANHKKGHELSGLLALAGLELKTLADFPAIDVVESGQTFAENAALKATVQAKHLGQWVLADDSGLMVDALDGAPEPLVSAPSTANGRRLDESTGKGKRKILCRKKTPPEPQLPGF